jgi:glycosyltransferase involved in cell wall biosynthesis
MRQTVPGGKMNKTLMTVSAEIPPNVNDEATCGERPRPDYLVISETIKADLIDYGAARRSSGRFGRLLEKLGGTELLLAWAAFGLRRNYETILTDGEQIGIPLAWMLKFLSWRARPRHLMVTHVLSVRKKQILMKLFGLKSHIDQFIVLSSFQRRFIIDQLGVPPAQVFLTPFMVDAKFYQPEKVNGSNPFAKLYPNRPLICSIGREFRDYETLIEAVRGMEVELIITTASPWSKRTDTTGEREFPPNVHINRFSYQDLRALYATSQFLVMPLQNVQFQAGVTAILEAMAMGKAVICTRIPGQTDIIEEGKTGLYVPPGNPPAMRAAIQYLIDHPGQAARMGRSARKHVIKELNLDCYAMRLSQLLR